MPCREMRRDQNSRQRRKTADNCFFTPSPFEPHKFDLKTEKTPSERLAFFACRPRGTSGKRRKHSPRMAPRAMLFGDFLCVSKYYACCSYISPMHPITTNAVIVTKVSIVIP